MSIDVPGLGYLRDVDWRGDHILLDLDSGLMVFDANEPSEPLFERDHDPLTSKAVLSPDGRWVFLHHGYHGFCLSTEDGAVRWWRQFSQGLVHVETARWTSDGASVVVITEGEARRVDAATGNLMGYLRVPAVSASEVTADGRAVAACVTTLPGHPDQLCISGLDVEPTHDRGPRPVPPLCGPPPAERIVLPDGACALAKIRWLDRDTVAVFNNRLHVVRDGAVALSLSLVRADSSGFWARRGGGPFVRARVLPESE